MWYHFLVTLFAVQMLGAVANSGNQRMDRQLKRMKEKCEITVCSHLIPDEGMNCVYQCASPNCYSSVYSHTPIEDGEIDYHRYRLFTLCVREEIKEANSLLQRKSRAQ
jgi:hypothetical protein